MTHRYSLRFETGERRGELVPITAARFTIGRRPGNSLQIIENSVSGEHAELVIEEGGVVLRDLGSTNGTRIGLERAVESRLDPGVQMYVGNVGLTLLDERAPQAGAAPPAAPPLFSAPPASAPSAPAGDAAPAGASADTVSSEAGPGDAGSGSGFEVSSADLERARKGSRSGLVLVVVLGALLGAGGWYFTRGAGSGDTRVATPVTPVPGNLLEVGYSFEDDEASASAGVVVTGGWSSRDGAPAGFLETPRAAVSGTKGLLAELEPGEWALHASREVRVQPGRILRFGAALSSDGPGIARVGVELFVPTDEDDEPGSTPGMMTVWSEGLEDGEARTVALQAAVPMGYRRARLVLLGSAPGEREGGEREDGEGTGPVARIEADDAWLVPQSGGEPSLTLDEFKFFALGEPATVAALYRVDDALVTGLRARATDAGTGLGIASWESELVDDGIQLRASGIDGPTSVTLRAEEGATSGGVATIGGEGYLRHSVEFERAGVTDLLLGSGLQLVRFRFAQPVQVKGRPAGRAFQITCELGDPSPFVLQLKFRNELDAAANLARDAEQAEEEGKLGLCLAKWQELLDSYPYDERHVSRAEETRGRLILKGLEEVRDISGQVERARFFRLIDLYRECRANSTDLAERFAGSEVEPEARRLAAELEGEIAALEVDLDRHEKARLEGILKTLEAQGAKGLAGEVQSYLAQHFGGAN